jgi:hypothetical protein
MDVKTTENYLGSFNTETIREYAARLTSFKNDENSYTKNDIPSINK